MKLRTIWTIPSMGLIERLLRSREAITQMIAASLPKRIKYWVTIQQIGNAVKMSANIPETPVEYILEHMDKPKNIH